MLFNSVDKEVTFSCARVSVELKANDITNDCYNTAIHNIPKQIMNILNANVIEVDCIKHFKNNNNQDRNINYLQWLKQYTININNCYHCWCKKKWTARQLSLFDSMRLRKSVMDFSSMQKIILFWPEYEKYL